MANYASLKAAIQQVVKTNGNNEITGALLQQTLFAMVNSLGGYYQFAGIATPTTNPGTPDQNVFYIASTAGTYSNFDSIVLADGEISILKYNGNWSKNSFGAASLEKVNELEQKVKNIYDGTESELSLITTTGYYITFDGRKAAFSSAILSSPILLNSGNVLKVTAYGNSAVAFISKTDAQGNTYVPVVVGQGPTSGSTIQYVEYVVEETGYYALSSLRVSLSATIFVVSNSVIKSILNEIVEIQGDITEIQDDVLDIDERLLTVYNGTKTQVQLTTTSGNYIGSNGSLRPFGSAIISTPILLNSGAILIVRTTGNSAVAFISKTDAQGSAYVPVVIGQGPTSGMTTQTVTYIVEESGYYALCSLNSTLSATLIDITGGIIKYIIDNDIDLRNSISEIQGSISDLQTDVNNVQDELNKIYDGSESELSLTTTSGYFITSDGRKVAFSSAMISSPILLNVGDILKVTAYGNSAVAFISKTDEQGSTYVPVVVGQGPTSGSTIQYVEYLVEETGYYALCSLRVSLSAILTSINGGIILGLANKISDINEEINDIQQEIETLKSGDFNYSISMFEKIACCGDSYVIAQIYNSGGVVGDRPNLSWGKNIGRIEGIVANIYASSGADTNTWQTRSTCLPAALAAEPSGLYLFCMGINDATYVTKGTMADITDYSDYHDYPNTFYGNYGKIIEQIMEHAPNSKIIIMTPCNRNYVANWLVPITEITNYYGIAMINTLESELIKSSDFNAKMIGGHPTAAQHGALALEIIKLVSNCIKNNYDYFKDYTGV